MTGPYWISSRHGEDVFRRIEPQHLRKEHAMDDNRQVIDDFRIEAAQIRLQQASGQVDTFEAIREIIANLFGSEEMALYRIDQERAVLWLTWSFGIDPHTHSMIDLLKEPALESVLKGRPFVAQSLGELKVCGIKEPVNAFIPVQHNGKTIAVLAIMRLLPQKQSIDANDQRLFQMLSAEIGSALSAERNITFLRRMLEEEL
jgi:hypothetical protein